LIFTVVAVCRRIWPKEKQSRTIAAVRDGDADPIEPFELAQQKPQGVVADTELLVSELVTAKANLGRDQAAVGCGCRATTPESSSKSGTPTACPRPQVSDHEQRTRPQA
jgi:hypothetical protein